MNPTFPPIHVPLAQALAASLDNSERQDVLTVKRDAIHAELDELEQRGQATEETASQIATKRISLDLFSRDLKRLQDEQPALERALAQAFHHFRGSSARACSEFEKAVHDAIAEAERKAREPFAADVNRIAEFQYTHADCDFATSEPVILKKYAPRLLGAWEKFTATTNTTTT